MIDGVLKVMRQRKRSGALESRDLISLGYVYLDFSEQRKEQIDQVYKMNLYIQVSYLEKIYQRNHMKKFHKKIHTFS